MPKRQLAYRDPNYTPRMTQHKASGRAVVRLNGKDHYLGAWGSKEAVVNYHKLIADWQQHREVTPQPLPQADGLTTNELILAYLQHANGYYKKDGEPTAELDCIKSAMRPLKELCGFTPVREFGPLKAKAVREQMLKMDWSRGFINRCMGRIKRMLRWGVENELVPPNVYAAVKAIEGLKLGRTTARETPGRHPVPIEHIEAVKKVVGQKLRDLIDLMLLTAARPGELMSLTGRMIDRTGEVWSAKLASHKTMHQGKERILFFGPQAQLILRRYLKKNPDARLWRQKSFRSGLQQACKRAGVPRFTPHWLRHTAATRIRAEFGLEAAQVLLGHSHADVTQIYAQKNREAGRAVALKIG